MHSDETMQNKKHKFMFETNDDGRIKFNDTSRITYEQWCKLKIQLNHLGYAFEDETDVKDYYNRGTWLNKDQSEVTLQVLMHKKPNTLFEQSQIDNDIQNAINEFGLTEIFDLAGYLLPDGTCLDFSDGQQMRVKDHREIADIMQDSLPENYNYNQPMIQFMNYGCVRLMGSGLALIQQPTFEQRQTIRRIVNQYDVFYVDICNNTGLTVKSFVYDIITNAGEILRDIDSYFKMISLD